MCFTLLHILTKATWQDIIMLIHLNSYINDATPLAWRRHVQMVLTCMKTIIYEQVRYISEHVIHPLFCLVHLYFNLNHTTNICGSNDWTNYNIRDIKLCKCPEYCYFIICISLLYLRQQRSDFHNFFPLIYATLLTWDQQMFVRTLRWWGNISAFKFYSQKKNDISMKTRVQVLSKHSY